jgi:HAE1 family hydrophobic/amphiphilic exporter-1
VNPPRFSVRQHILVNLLFFLLMIAGLVALARIPVDFYPDISFNTAQITTEWTGASAEEIERLITTKLEDEIETVSGIKEIRSRSSADRSIIEIDWQETLSDEEYDRSLADLRAAIDRVSDLPEDAEEPVLRELSVGEVYASVMVAVTDQGGVGEHALREVARDLKDRIDDVEGVRRVTLRGARERELHVLVDKNALMAADLTLAEVSDIIRRNNQNVPAGSLTLDTGETTIRATGDFTTPAALAATVARKSPDGTHVTLREIARIEPAFEKQRLIGRHNGKPSIILEVAKESDADLFEMVSAVKALLQSRESLLPAGVGASVTFDTSSYVRRRVNVLRDNLVVGVGVVVAILWFTLGFRNALLAVIAIPFSYLTAILFFPILGITVNSLSIVGMILVGGMLVDDAIIVLENVYRHVEEGKPLQTAVIEGTDEVLWPVIASVTTTIAAFFPLLLVSGTSGEFMSILPKTVIVCLLASLLECLFTLPAHYVRLGSRGHGAPASLPNNAWGALQRWSYSMRNRVDAALDRLRDRYVRLLRSVLNNRLPFFTLIAALAIFAVGMASRLPVDLFANEFSNFFVSVYAPTSYGLEQTDAVMKELEAILDELPPEDLRDYSTYVGMAMNPDTIPISGPHLGVIYLTMADTTENREDPHRVVRKVKERMDAWWEANRHRAQNVMTMPPRDGPPVGKPVAVQIRAEDYGLAKDIAREMKGFLVRLPGVYNIEDNLLPGTRELRLKMNEAKASLYGLTFQELATALRAANDGLVSSTFKDPAADEDVDIRVLYGPEHRSTEQQLLDTELRTAQGFRIKLGDVADIEIDRGFMSLGHHQTRRSVIVYADVVEGLATSESANRALQEQFKDLATRYPGVEVVYGGEFQETQRAFSNMFRVFPLALLLIYVILAAEFRSYAQPLIVMLAVPFGIIGVILGLSIFGYPLSFGVMYVVVGLSGVVVNDSLVLVDFANHARDRGLDPFEAVLSAGRTRLRPVLLTTATTVGALLPTALGLFGRSLSFGPFAASFATGLSLATIFTLLVVPVSYCTLHEILLRRQSSGVAYSPQAPELLLGRRPS